MSDKKLFGGEVDRDLAELAEERLDHGEKTDIIRDLVEAIAYGGRYDERTALDVQIERKEDELEKARDRRRQADARIETLENELSDLRRRREGMRSTEEKLEASLIGVESDLRAGRRIHIRHGMVQSIAREYDLDPEDVLEKLRSRNPDVPDTAFDTPEELSGHRAGQNPAKWEGLPSSQQDLPVEKRGGDYEPES